MLESIVLGAIQGIAEWLPVSSEGLIFLAKLNFFNNGESISEIAKIALFLHLGTFFSALLYFRKDVLKLIKELFDYKNLEKENKTILNFFIVSALFSGVLGYSLLFIVDKIGEGVDDFMKYIILLVGLLLLFTAWLQFKANGKKCIKQEKDLKINDGFMLGLVQAFSALPGLSRSGLTVASLMIMKFKVEVAIRISFLMSLPIVLGGNIILNFNKLAFSLNNCVGFLVSFIFGLLTIEILLRVSRNINFGWFVFAFGVLTIISVFI